MTELGIIYIFVLVIVFFLVLLFSRLINGYIFKIDDILKELREINQNLKRIVR